MNEKLRNCGNCSSARTVGGKLYCDTWDGADEVELDASNRCEAWTPLDSCAWEGCGARGDELVGGVHLCRKHACELCEELAGELVGENPYPEDLFRDLAGRAARVGWNAALWKLRSLFDD